MVKTLLPLQGAKVQPQVRDLRSRMPWDVAKRFKKKKDEVWAWPVLLLPLKDDSYTGCQCSLDCLLSILPSSSPSSSPLPTSVSPPPPLLPLLCLVFLLFKLPSDQEPSTTKWGAKNEYHPLVGAARILHPLGFLTTSLLHFTSLGFPDPFPAHRLPSLILLVSCPLPGHLQSFPRSP